MTKAGLALGKSFESNIKPSEYNAQRSQGFVPANNPSQGVLMCVTYTQPPVFVNRSIYTVVCNAMSRSDCKQINYTLHNFYVITSKFKYY